MTGAILEALARALGPVIKEYVEKELAPLRAQIKALDARPTLEYRGTWTRGMPYGTASGVTHRGSLWIARGPTVEEPGDGATSWQLAAKRGRDGKDAR